VRLRSSRLLAMTEIFVMKLEEIQPCQLFINSEKLASVLKDYDRLKPDSLAPVPVKNLNGQIIITDGHTRALAAFLRGFSEIRVFWEEEDLDWEAYEICLEWCKSEGICTIADLKDRVVSSREFEVLWVERCRKMEDHLELKRRQNNKACMH
jgi:hypothetical protein